MKEKRYGNTNVIVSYDIDGVLAEGPPPSEKKWGRMKKDERVNDLLTTTQIRARVPKEVMRCVKIAAAERDMTTHALIVLLLTRLAQKHPSFPQSG